MRRFTRSVRTHENTYETSALRTQFIRQLTQETESLMKQLREQFFKDFEEEAAQIVKRRRSRATANEDENEYADTINSVGTLALTGLRYLISRPRTSQNTQESSRSIDADARFKLSQSQAAREAQTMIGQGDKNA